MAKLDGLQTVLDFLQPQFDITVELKSGSYFSRKTDDDVYKKLDRIFP